MNFIKFWLINDIYYFERFGWGTRFHELKFSSDVPQQNYDGCNGDPYLIFIKHLKPYF